LPIFRILGVIVATTQLGIDLSFLTANIHLLVAGIIAFLAISLGLGSRTIAANLLAGFYTKQIFETGQEVFIANQKAKVKSVNDVCVIFTTEKGELVVPNERLMSKA
jgi:small-conductance mechanosensitive channel